MALYNNWLSKYNNPFTFYNSFNFIFMQQKNLLKLHDDIIVALINIPDSKGSFDRVANFIELKGLFPVRKGNIPLSTQVMLRSCKSKGRYFHLFKKVSDGIIQLRNI